MKLIPVNAGTVSKAAGNLRRRIIQLTPHSVTAPFEPQRTPFEKYFRDKLLRKINLKEVNGLTVLEVGCGIGDLLQAASQHQPKELYGTDESQAALEIAHRFLDGLQVDLSLAPVTDLPFPDASFDVVYVLFELQYLDDDALPKAVEEICRVSRQQVVLVEETATRLSVASDLIYRTVGQYQQAFHLHRFQLRKTGFLDIAFSRAMFGMRRTPYHWIRWFFSPFLFALGYPTSIFRPPTYDEAEPATSKRALWLQKVLLPLTRSLDNILLPSSGITILKFERERLFSDN